MMNNLSVELDHLRMANEILADGFSHLPPMSETIDYQLVGGILRKLALEMQDNYPYHHAFYLGQMLKPPHPVARLAYQNAMLVNPNNHALDGGRASSALEKNVVAQIGEMFGFSSPLGHLTSGGTMANLEALWVAREENGGTVLASDQAHYTHSRISSVLNIPFEAVSTDPKGRMSLSLLRERLSQGGVGTVVVTLGTTAMGAIDPLADILALREIYHFRIHVDAAYGGYFVIDKSLGKSTRQHFDCVGLADSVAIDPHKHGLQPYGCGCILFADPAVGRHYKHDSPYTYFSSNELHLGEISLECSRAGAAACALWATMEYFPLESGGLLSKRLAKSRRAAMRLREFILDDNRFFAPWEPELDILVWLPKASKASEITARSKAIFESSAQRDVHLALCVMPKRMLIAADVSIGWDENQVTCLRACLMKPEHDDCLRAITKRLLEAFDDALDAPSLCGARYVS